MSQAQIDFALRLSMAIRDLFRAQGATPKEQYAALSLTREFMAFETVDPFQAQPSRDPADEASAAEPPGSGSVS